MLVSQELPQPTSPRLVSEQSSGLASKRILVVEDDVLIRLDIVSELRNAGCIVIGPASRLEAAMTLAEGRILMRLFSTFSLRVRTPGRSPEC